MATETPPSPETAFGRRLCHELCRAGLTAPDLAAALGVSRTAMMRWTAGRGLPTGRLLVRMADHLGVTTDWLLGRERPGARP